MKFNTAIAEMMMYVNEATRTGKVPRDHFRDFLRLLQPFAPHLCAEIWDRLGFGDGILDGGWPALDEAKLAVDTIQIAVQVNGKLRANIQVAPDAASDVVIAAAKADANVARFIEGKELKREVYVPGRLVNLVVVG
jgi:leucyl-tRNA synthetase